MTGHGGTKAQSPTAGNTGIHREADEENREWTPLDANT